MVSYIGFTTHNSVNCGYDTCRGSPRGSPGGSPSSSFGGSRGVRSASSCTESGPICRRLDCSASRKSTNPGKWSSAFPGISSSRDQTRSLTGRLRQGPASGHRSTGPRARGKHPPCGFPLLKNIKDLAFLFGRVCCPLVACRFTAVQIEEVNKN